MWHPIAFTLNVKMPVNYVGDLEAFSRISFEQLLSTGGNARPIRNKIVIVGVTSPGQGDVTPLSGSGKRLTSGPVLWANAVNTLLTEQYIRVLHPLGVYGLLLGYCIAIRWGFRRVDESRKQVALGLGSIVSVIVLGQLLFMAFRFQMVMMPFVMVGVLVQCYMAARQAWGSRDVDAKPFIRL